MRWPGRRQAPAPAAVAATARDDAPWPDPARRDDPSGPAPVAGASPITDAGLDLHAHLIETLYAGPVSLALGAACGLGSTLIIATMTHDAVLMHIACAMALVVAWRIGLGLRYAGHKGLLIAAETRRGGTSARAARPRARIASWFTPGRRFAISGIAYTVLLGAMGGRTVQLAATLGLPENQSGALASLAVANVVGYVAGIAGRNAGQPAIVRGQLVGALIPLSIGCLLTGDPLYGMLVGLVILFGIALHSLTRDTNRVLTDAISAAQRMSHMAVDMARVAVTDRVTGLANRAGLDHWLDERINARPPRPFALFWFDLDRFKEINDTLGHPVGDHLLATLGDRLRALVAAPAIVARFGGDEFVLGIPGMSREDADAFGRTLLTVIAEPMTIERQQVAVTASLGVAMHPGDATSAATIMQRADLALYASKTAGRATSTFFDADMDQEQARRRLLEEELRNAVRAGEIRLHYQPIVDLSTGRIAAMEALVRWDHPIHGQLGPDRFIALAEQTGLIITLGNWIALEACRAAATWPRHIGVAVNVSPIQMQAAGAALGFMNALRTTGLDPRRLELEITENVFADRTDDIAEFIRLIRQAGVGLSLDDFGAGYSSLSYIRDFDFSKLKVDRSFIAGLAAGDRASAIVMAIGDLARRLGIPIVAEGIETATSADLVRRLGCTHGQGYWYSPPVPLAEATALIAADTAANHRAAS